MNTEHSVVMTENVEKVKAAVQSAVRASGFTAVIADVGSGKSTMYNYLTSFWKMNPDRYNVIALKGFRSEGSRVSEYMRRMITGIEPDATIPASTESRYDALATILLRAHNNKRKVILAIDEAQDLSLQTWRDLKKVHEISGPGRDHLFTIIALGKPTGRWVSILETQEIGYRAKIVQLGDLKNEEIFNIAKMRFGVEFDTFSTRDRFIPLVQPRTPLGVEYATNLIISQDTFSGIATEEHLLKAQSTGLMRFAKSLGITQEMIRSGVEKKIWSTAIKGYSRQLGSRKNRPRFRNCKAVREYS